MLSQKDIAEKTRVFMKKENLNFLIVFSTDEFLNEYVSLNENARYLLTGFWGPTGDALVTEKEIFLFVDGRYHLQADEETDRNLVSVVKVGMDKSPITALFEKIVELSDSCAKIGIVTQKISCGHYKKLLEVLTEKNAEFAELDFDPVIQATGIKTEEKIFPLRYISEEISGLSPEEKLDLIIKENEKKDIDVLVVTKLEEIAYLTNLRGSEIPYSSSFKAKALINHEKCIIFVHPDKITSEIKEKLGKKFIFEDGDYNINYLNDLVKLKQKVNIGFDLNSMNLHNCRKLERTNLKLVNDYESPIALMKSVKNGQELQHMQECFLKTDIVINRAICWLDQLLEKGENVSEKDLSQKVKEFYIEEGALGLSFETIAASGRNSAFIHYTKASPDKFIETGELVLLDSGGYFEGGYATDITRTFVAGGKKSAPDKKQKEIYTKVLKGFLAGINYKIDENTTGFDIDQKVREIIWQDKPEGFNFLHGTGHGVGISVHESPPRLGPSELSKTKLKAGMCFTVEPGLYCDSWGGVRIENTVAVIEKDKNLYIKSLTKANLDDNLIEEAFLTEEEKKWLEDYKKQAIG